jgi:predicted nuclease of predicted toxin-antitoxin system
VRFPVDQNLPASVAACLATAGQDAQHTSTLDLERADDEDLFEWCRLHDAVLLTADKRLTKYLATQRASSPSVVVARGYLLDFPKLAADVLADLDAIAQVIGSDGHAVFSMGPDRPTRAQLLPLVT